MSETRSDTTVGGTDPAYCQSCGSELSEGSQFCSACGTEVGTSDSSTDHTGLKILGGGSAVISVIFLPILFGPISMVIGYLLYQKGEEQAGRAIGIGGFVCMCLGFLLGFLFFASLT